MFACRTIAVLLLAAGLAAQATAGFAQENIGSAAGVKNRVEGVVHGQAQTLSSGSAVYANELVRTAASSQAELVFLDRTKLSVGPTSEVRLDKFVYNPARKPGSVVVSAGRGAYRFVTGEQDSHNYEIKTPYAVLGVRGTILEIVIEDQPNDSPGACGSGFEKVKLVEGGFVATTIAGRTVSVTQPGTVLSVCSNGSFTTTQVASSILNFSPETLATLPDALPLAGLATLAAAAAALAIETKTTTPSECFQNSGNGGSQGNSGGSGSGTDAALDSSTSSRSCPASAN